MENLLTGQEPAIKTLELRKIYKSQKNDSIEALKGLDIEVPRGSFFGLLGPNGAGKSTFINILAGLVNRTSGQAKICGYYTIKDMRLARMSIGVVPQELVLDPFFTAREALDVQAGYYGIKDSNKKTDAILEAVGLSDQADAYARSLSGGMRRRLMVAKALVHSPPVVILDEPTAGVDVELRQQLWAYLRELNESGTTIVLTTHYLEEAEALCDKIAIIYEGSLVACDKTSALLAPLDKKEIIITTEDALDVVPKELNNLDCKILSPHELLICYKSRNFNISKLLDKLSDGGINIIDITTKEADLEDAFLHLTSSAKYNMSD
ncbi:MAG: multidrug ABC transporter ATP-binding protein [Rhodospirillaceae bacterium]|nr:multidrug ABC transporter ATP-binding protein [Rhodospirillaceae bacterium]